MFGVLYYTPASLFDNNNSICRSPFCKLDFSREHSVGIICFSPFGIRLIFSLIPQGRVAVAAVFFSISIVQYLLLKNVPRVKNYNNNNVQYNSVIQERIIIRVSIKKKIQYLTNQMKQFFFSQIGEPSNLSTLTHKSLRPFFLFRTASVLR